MKWLAAAAVVLGFVSYCYAQPVSSTELIEQAGAFDGKTVTFAGEVVGEVMGRGDHAWVNLNDGTNAIGVWVEKKSVSDIIYTGSHKARGDWLEVTGIFNRACRQHGGDLDIHAQAVRTVSPGRLVPERLNTSKVVFFLVLTGVLCLTVLLMRLKPR